jgi:hypothetical protein
LNADRIQVRNAHGALFVDALRFALCALSKLPLR